MSEVEGIEPPCVSPFLLRKGASESLAKLLAGLVWHANFCHSVAENFYTDTRIRRTYAVRFSFGQDSIPQVASLGRNVAVYFPLEEPLRLITLCALIAKSINDKLFTEQEILSENYLDTLNGILRSSEGLFEAFDRRVYPLFSGLLVVLSSQELVRQASRSAEDLAAMGEWAVSFTGVLFRGVCAFSVGHEYAHVSRRHVDIKSRLARLRATDPQHHSRVKTGMEGEADILAEDQVARLCKLLVVEHCGEFSHIPHQGLKSVLNRADVERNPAIASEFALGMIHFTYFVLKLVRTFRSQGPGNTYDDLRLRDYIVRHFGVERNTIVEMEPWNANANWKSGYSLALESLGRFTQRHIAKNCARSDGPFALPPFAYWNRDLAATDDQAKERAHAVLRAVEDWRRGE